ncbi:MAG: MFS transporter [Acidimicrobiales bacterium]|nr:MFS transporter [Acidimicrobiales bacterium]
MNRQQRILAAGLFVVAWGTNVSTPLILRYQDRLSLSDTGAVGIFTIYVIGILFSLLFAGRLSDRFGRRPVILPFTCLSGIASLTLVLGRNSLLLLLLGRLLLGAVSGAVLSVGTAWLSELNEGGSTAVERLRLAGVTTAMIYVGFGFGPITSALYERFGSSPLMVPYVFHAVVTFAVVAAMIKVPETKRADPDMSLRPQVGVPAISRREFLGVLAPAAIWVFGFPSTSFALFPVILRDAVGSGSDVLVAGVTGTLTALSALLSRPVLRRVGNARNSLLVGLRIGVAGYVVGTLAFVTDLWQLVPLAAVLMGSASGIILTAGLALTDAIADDTNRGALSATYYFAAYCGMAMPVIITLLAEVSSVALALSAITLLSAATAIFLSIQMRTQPAV